MRLHTTLLSALALASLASSAWADTPRPSDGPEVSLHLDYKASGLSCPEADRFADEVSSKLGFVPWHDDSSDRLVVRIRLDGGEAVASLELPNGDSKVLRDTSCQALFPALVAAVTVAIDSRSQAAPAEVNQNSARKSSAKRPRHDKASPMQARVHVRSETAGVVVSRITARAMFAGSNGATAAGMGWEELCIAPCSFELDAGLSEIMISGVGPVATHKISLEGGKDSYLVARPGSTGLLYGGYGIASLGLTAAILGSTFMVVGTHDYDTGERSTPGWSIAALVGGLGATGLGIGMMYKARSHLDRESRPDQGSMVNRAVSLSGTF